MARHHAFVTVCIRNSGKTADGQRHGSTHATGDFPSNIHDLAPFRLFSVFPNRSAGSPASSAYLAFPLVAPLLALTVVVLPGSFSVGRGASETAFGR
jgi:hypothetical protein